MTNTVTLKNFSKEKVKTGRIFIEVGSQMYQILYNPQILYNQEIYTFLHTVGS